MAAYSTPDPPAKRGWFDYAEKLFLPIAILVATWIFNVWDDGRKQAAIAAQHNEQKSAEKEARTLSVEHDCIDLNIKLAALSQPGSAATLTAKSAAGQAASIATIGEYINSMCQDAGFPRTYALTQALDVTRQKTTDVGIAAAAQQALGQSLPQVAVVAPGIIVPLASSSLRKNIASVPTRVYIQVQNETQRAAAEELAHRLDLSTFRGGKIVAPPIQLVNSGPHNTELRCVKRSDCVFAPQLAAYISNLMGGARVNVKDLSSLYDASSAARLGHYELWLSSGAFSVNGSGSG